MRSIRLDKGVRPQFYGFIQLKWKFSGYWLFLYIFILPHDYRLHGHDYEKLRGTLEVVMQDKNLGFLENYYEREVV